MYDTGFNGASGKIIKLKYSHDNSISQDKKEYKIFEFEEFRKLNKDGSLLYANFVTRNIFVNQKFMYIAGINNDGQGKKAAKIETLVFKHSGFNLAELTYLNKVSFTTKGSSITDPLNLGVNLIKDPTMVQERLMVVAASKDAVFNAEIKMTSVKEQHGNYIDSASLESVSITEIGCFPKFSSSEVEVDNPMIHFG